MIDSCARKRAAADRYREQPTASGMIATKNRDVNYSLAETELYLRQAIRLSVSCAVHGSRHKRSVFIRANSRRHREDRRLQCDLSPG